MGSRFVRLLIVLFAISQSFIAFAEEKTSVDKAREALAQQDGEGDSTKELEEVFQAAEANYSLAKAGGKSLSYSLSYSYTSDSRIDIEIVNQTVRNLDVNPSASHSFTNSFSFSYGILDNLTLSTTIPLSTRYDSQRSLSITDWGDVSLGVRWQPFPYIPGRATVTINSSLGTKTGVSPYEIDPRRQLSTGSGTYSITTGLSVSKIVDPVALFGSLSSTYTLEENGLNQVRGGQILQTVQQGQSFSFSGGFSYSLSYDTSLSISAQIGYSTETKLFFRGGNRSRAPDSANGSMNMSLGIRVDPTTIVNTSFGFGLTEDASDFNLGVSYPINIGAFNW